MSVSHYASSLPTVWRHVATLAALWLLTVPASHAASAADNLQRLLKSDWEWQMREFPTYASSLGDHRYDDRLTDYSINALRQRQAHVQHLDRALRRIPRQGLNADDRLSYDLLLRNVNESLELDRLLKGDPAAGEWTLLGHLYGIHIAFSQMMASTRFETLADYHHYLARLRAFPAQVDQALAISRHNLNQGWSLPRVTMERVPAQIDRLLGESIATCSWFAPFATLPRTLTEAERATLRTEALAVLAEQTIPALRRLRAHIVDDYLPQSRSSVGADALPAGAPFYQFLLRQNATTDQTAEEIHQLGLAEVARIHGAMDAIARAEGFDGRGVEFLAALRQRPDQYFASGDELLAAYGALGKRIDPLMPALFRQLPRLPWGVRAAPPEEQGNSAYYLPGAADGSRAGYFVVDTSSPKTSAKFEMTALLLHEAVPGHHLQGSRAAELPDLPDFRRQGWYVAYGEGWALYAESLGEELGLYGNRLDLLGRYSFEIWRAARLVVDTGLHAKGWSRQQAIEYLRATTAGDPEEITSEIDRYIAWPGQAVGYKIGELTFQRLRAEARQRLGDRFDLRAFHSVLIDAGALPLSLVEQRVRDWVARGGTD